MGRLWFWVGMGVLGCGVGRADVMVYTSRSGFDTAVSTTSYGFTASSPQPTRYGTTNEVYSFGPVTFQDPGYYGVSFLALSPLFPSPGTRIYLDDQYPLALQLSFPETRAFGLEVNTGYAQMPTDQDLVFEVDGQSFAETVPPMYPYDPHQPVPDPAPTQFVEFVSDAPFDRLTITEPSDLPSTDNDIDVYGFTIAQTATTPEPGSFVLLGTGLLAGVGVVRRRWEQKAGSPFGE